MSCKHLNIAYHSIDITNRMYSNCYCIDCGYCCSFKNDYLFSISLNPELYNIALYEMYKFLVEYKNEVQGITTPRHTSRIPCYHDGSCTYDFDFWYSTYAY